MSIFQFFLIISASQGVIFGFAILFSPFFKSSTNNYLGYSILILSFLMFNVYLDAIDFYIDYPRLFIFYDIEWIFLFPVFFFLYILKSINHHLEKSKKLLWLYLPFILSVLINTVVNIENIYHWYSYPWKHKELFYDWLFGFQEFGYYSYNFLLAIWAYVILLQKKYMNHPSTKWLKNLCICVFSLVTSWVILDIADMIFDIGYKIGIVIICGGGSIFMFWVLYYGVYMLKLSNDDRSTKRSLLDLKETFEKTTQRKLEISDHSFSENNRYFQKLENLFQQDYIYRNPDLNRDTIAKLLNISSGYVSQIVNDVTKKNFTGYVNSYRIKEVKKMILDTEYDKYSLLAIGLEAGFKSKTTFYTSFKKETGLTPSQYKSKYKKVLNS
ncbi:helix-turn-helix domain-containing protein [Aquimarina algicola]|uniref:AraC family transcriptional regulator n=1 Tax=Aquimarina algicola TaxID=2589995 RepID=A0A504JAB2_9FLAO|nr:helix-turn-helix domain-containing protein [Aquimarina algicola]TPN87594.1 AraC family transcriptional regulator [Aquimarina algicola]